MTLKRLFCAVVLLALGWGATAQSYEEFRRQALAEYARADSAWRKEYRDFRDQANADYAENMKKAWEELLGNEPIPAPEPEPVVPPVVLPELEIPVVIEDNYLAIEDIVLPPEELPAPEPVAPIVKPKGPTGPQHQFAAFGSTFSVSLNTAKLPKLTAVGESAVSKMWKALSAPEYDAMLADLLALRKEMDLCDWAYYELVKALADDVYANSSDAATVFCAFALCQSGFKLRLARAPQDSSLHMIMATDNMMYNHPYWELDGATYYLVDNSRMSMLKIYRDAFPGEKVLRLAFSQKNKFPVRLTEIKVREADKYPAAHTVTQVNQNLLDFYERYPESFINSDTKTRWRFYAVDLSDEAKSTLYPVLRGAIAGKSELDAVNLLLNYVQTGYEYEYDEDIWGYDRAFFPDETLHYPYCDCEDRSIFFSRLVRDLLGLKVTLVYYPGHLATAVRFNEQVTGDYVLVGKEKYIVCDPTFINAPVGMTAPDEDNSTAFLMPL
jgi:hypothetical protein